VKKDQQHHISAQLAQDSVLQVRGNALQALAARVALAKDVHFSVVKFAVSVQKKIL
jgi:hypothetical protein